VEIERDMRENIRKIPTLESKMPAKGYAVRSSTLMSTYSSLSQFVRVQCRTQVRTFLSMMLLAVGGSILIAQEPQAAVPPASAVSVASFGAQGNGVADDTQAISNALASLKSGSSLRFESGRTYLISGSISVNDKSNIGIYGQNATIRAKNGMPSGNGNYILMFRGGSNINVYDLAVDGNRANRTAQTVWAHNIIVRSTKTFNFYNVAANNGTTDGFFIDASNNASTLTYPTNGLLSNCKANNNSRQALTIVNAWYLKVIGGSYTNTNGSWPKAGIDLEADAGTASPSSRDVTIQGVRLTGNGGYGIQLSHVGTPTGLVVEGNYLANNLLGGVHVDTTSSIVRNNLIENYSRVLVGTFMAGTRGMVDLPAASYVSRNVVSNNTIRNITTGTPAIFIHSHAGTGNQIINNCMQNFNGGAVANYQASSVVSGNSSNPGGGCPVPNNPGP